MKSIPCQEQTKSAARDAGRKTQLIDGAGKIMDAPTETDRHYYYRPCQFDGGETMKCAGFGGEREDHRKFYVEYWTQSPLPNVMKNDFMLPGVVIVSGYHGDKISRAYGIENALHNHLS